MTIPSPLRRLVIVLGDQLDIGGSALRGFDPARDAIWMAEVREESTHVPSAKMRIAVFLSAMRHFAAQLRESGFPLLYTRLGDAGNAGTLGGELRKAVDAHGPGALVLTAPGDWRVLRDLREVARQAGLPLEVRDDTHFLNTVRAFADHASHRKQLRMEYFYREVRRATGLLMDGGKPVGGQWNFDASNRSSLPASGPERLSAPRAFPPDAITQEVLRDVERHFPDHPGQLETFDWPVTRADALAALDDFIEHRLPLFGRYQDAIWAGEPWLYHSRLSSAMNLKLLGPREVAAAAERAYRDGHAPIEAVEGFIRQVIGWREYVRGIYWTQMPAYLQRNALQATRPLPTFYWSGDVSMACLRDAIGQTLRHGYAHHIQRLMVTGLYALLLGVDPREVHNWYLSVYVDAVEWVEVPNTLGMSQFADGGLMASKPYAASGKYIQRMSNYCQGCRYQPGLRTGENACPFTTLYWDFLIRNERALAGIPRMAMQLKHLRGLDASAREAIGQHAQSHRQRVCAGASP